MLLQFAEFGVVRGANDVLVGNLAQIYRGFQQRLESPEAILVATSSQFFGVFRSNVFRILTLASFERGGQGRHGSARLIQSAQIHQRRLATLEFASDALDVGE